MLDHQDLIQILTHWLSTPANAYYGQSYGADLNTFLLVPMNENLANQFIDKLKRDIPMLANVDINLWQEDNGFEQKRLYLEIGKNITIDLTQLNQG